MKLQSFLIYKNAFNNNNNNQLLFKSITNKTTSYYYSTSITGPTTRGSIQLTINNRLATLTLSNPTARNALSPTMMQDFYQHVQSLQKNKDISVVILRGDQATFCSGFDLSTGLETKEEGVKMCEYMQNVTKLLHRMPKIVIAHIQGSAFGGGAELLTACDHRIMSPTAQVRFVHASIHISPGWGGASRLAKLVGRSHALRLIGTGKLLTPAEALKIGFIDEINDDIASFVAPYLIPHPSSIHAIKQGIVTSTDIDDSMYEIEKLAFGDVWASEPNLEARRKLMNRLHVKNLSSLSSTNSNK
jgi:enoyl-CoA hydratase/carnithine racemase